MYSLRSATVSLSRCATSLARFAGGSSARKGARSANARMRPMTQSPGRFRAALLIGWLLLGAAGMVYARLKDIPGWAAWPVLAAFLVEYPFYLLPAFPELRDRLSGARLPPFLVVSALLPYLTCFLALGHLQWIAVLRLAALALALGLWYLLLPVRTLTDIAFLVLIAAVLIGKYFDVIYPLPYSGLNISVLGHIALIHMTILVLVVERRVHETGFGFVPNWREWRIGLLHYAGCLPVAALVAFPLQAVHFTTPAPLWKTAGTFLAFFLVVGLLRSSWCAAFSSNGWKIGPGAAP